MRLKVSPRDFRVEEQLDFEHQPDGEFFVHVLQKEKLGTLDAVAEVARLAGVPRSDVAFAGLKDRQGSTDQFVSIRGAQLDHRGHGLRIRCVGRAHRPITSKMSRGNRFSIVLRELRPAELTTIEHNVESAREDGFPNYFDDQRFGCVRHGQGFAMRAVLEGRFERALRRLIATPSPVAKGGDTKLKRILAASWGDWDKCAAIARGPVYRRLFDHLTKRPDDFRGALEVLPVRQKLIHAYAYQSLLWNKALSRWLESKVKRSRQARLSTLVGDFLGWTRLEPELCAELRRARTPLFGAVCAGGDSDFAAAAARTLRDAGLDAAAFRDNEIDGMVLREEYRPGIVVPRRLEVRKPRGHGRLELSFNLPRGAYATMLIKRLTATPVSMGRPRRRQQRQVNDD